MSNSRYQSQRPSIKRKKSAHVIALITDFGLKDQYVGVVKGVILSINPAVQIVDIIHDIAPQRVRQAGYLLWSTYKYFPEGTIFVNIVDPGVGSKRRIIGMKTKRFTFLAPNNGILDFILSTEKVVEEVEITEKEAGKYLTGPISSTFHGRDVFAPLAAYLSKGVPLKRLGLILTPQEIAPPFVHSQLTAVHPCILHIDHFGNIITNLAPKDIANVTMEMQAVSIDRNFVSRWIQFYDEAPENTPCLIIGSSGLVEISVKNSSAARLLNATLDTPVKVYWR
jgi:S-adenosylmethionine hydrolase